jgi:hypothetical protein
MYLDAVSAGGAKLHIVTNGWRPHRAPFEPWADWPVTMISHHGRACCETAREWMSALDFSALNAASVYSGPRWLRKRYEWGPSVYPIHWCEIDSKSQVDCGVHAALAHEVFSRRGVRSYRAQIVQEFSHEATTQWRSKWSAGEAITAWIDGRNIYHEAVAVEMPNGSLKLWDPSAASWIDPRQNGTGYGSLLAIKITARPDAPDFTWGSMKLRPNEWVETGSIAAAHSGGF